MALTLALATPGVAPIDEAWALDEADEADQPCPPNCWLWEVASAVAPEAPWGDERNVNVCYK